MRRIIAILAVSILLAAGVAVAQEKKGATAPQEKKSSPGPAATTQGKKATAAPALTEQEMMAKMMKLATPGEGHKILKQMVGTWNCEIKSWMAPGAKMEVSKGTAENKLILGGRFVYSENRGTFANMPFEGIGIFGYDNFRKEYVSVWMDTMDTGIYETRGYIDKTGKILTAKGIWDDPMTGGKIKVRIIDNFVSNDTITEVMYQTGADGKEFKSMEMTYTRQGK